LPTEIEHKYRVDTASWKPTGQGVLYRQGYLTSSKDCVVRVRIAGEAAFLTVKGATQGISRLEFEYPIPVDEAAEMLERLAQGPLIEKTRHTELHAGRTWEIDIFHGDNDGLVIAEVEVPHADDVITTPPWVLGEVSDDRRYFNNSLVTHPYKNWRDE
jgi:adenylate cyclase